MITTIRISWVRFGKFTIWLTFFKNINVKKSSNIHTVRMRMRYIKQMDFDYYNCSLAVVQTGCSLHFSFESSFIRIFTYSLIFADSCTHILYRQITPPPLSRSLVLPNTTANFLTWSRAKMSKISALLNKYSNSFM